MKLNFDEIDLLQDAEVLRQKIQEVMGILQEKGFEAKIESPSLWETEMLCIDNTLYLNLRVSISLKKKEEIPGPFLRSFEETIKKS